MIDQTRAELLKIRSTRTTAGLLTALIGLVLLFVVLSGLLTKPFDLSHVEDQRTLLSVGSFASLFAAIAGVLVIANEYRYGTIRPTLLFTPQRTRVIGAKLAAGMLAGLVFGTAAAVLVYAIGRAILAGRGIDYVLDGHDVALILLGSTVGTALWGGIGVGLGAILRNQVASLIVLLAWILIIDGTLFALVPEIGRLTPTGALRALLGDTDSDLVSPAAGAALLVAWVALLGGAGLLLTKRRDVD